MTFDDLPDKLATWGGKRILFAMATDAEYRENLRARISPLVTGVGPIEAGIVCAAALGELDRAGLSPDLLVSLGSAGSRTLGQGTVHEIASVTYRDMDASPLGFEKGKTPFLDEPAEIELPVSIPGLPRARLSTGANIISGDMYDAIDADMVDMESYAVVRAARLFGVRFCGLRGVSDGAEDLKHYGDWADYLPIVDEALGAALDSLKAALEAA